MATTVLGTHVYNEVTGNFQYVAPGTVDTALTTAMLRRMTNPAIWVGGVLPTVPPLPGPGGLTQAEVDARVAVGTAALTTGAPALLDTLAEIDAALANDPNFATTIVTALAGKVPTSRQVAGQTLATDVTVGTLMNTLGIALIVRVDTTTHQWPTITIPAGFTGRIIYNSDDDPLAVTPPSGPDGYYWERYNP
jgi:hypothetical protein